MRLKLEKHEVVRDDDRFIRVTVFEPELDVWAIRDITHHNDEKNADAYISETWHIVPPPLGGEVTFPEPPAD